MAKATSKDNHSLDTLLVRKASLEVDLLAEQLSARHRRREAIKAAAAASALILALISLIGGAASIVGWFIQQEQDRDLRTEERLDRALTQLSEERPAQRVAAVSSLQSLLSADDERNSRIAVSVANAIASENDHITMNAMTSFFADLPTELVSKGSRNKALKTLVVNQRGMLGNQSFLFQNANSTASTEFLKEPLVSLRLQAINSSIITLLREGAKIPDMSFLYLPWGDFSGMDLSSVKFDHAFLKGSDFDGANLRRASFKAANLDNVSFVESDLRDASLTFDLDHEDTLKISAPLSELISERYNPPILRCADLRRANLSGFPILDFTTNANRNKLGQLDNVDFGGANLEGTNFEKMAVYFEVPKKNGFTPTESLFYIRGQYPVVSETLVSSFIFLAVIDQRPTIAGNISDFSEALADLKTAFRKTNASKARFPAAVRPFLPAELSNTTINRAGCKRRKHQSVW